ncbi:hypothetical protein TorRG33x02_139240 [Trema orientale]|uniref:Protein TAPETUM DETERMINANT n=1 Tax=Trema orientale TaxID=63057 RepID=A0A2P5EXL0_TREOI|nr:hypothetical protein TorRG33x02_139240 [Trema orientale]
MWDLQVKPKVIQGSWYVIMRGVLRSIILSEQRFFVVSVAVTCGFFLALFYVTELFELRAAGEAGIKRLVFSKENSTGLGRKLLQSAINTDGGNMNRISTTTCSKEDIAIFQRPAAPLSNGIPSYTVQILNVCVSGCSLSDIHVKCGWFSSVCLVNPTVFRRIDYDDCLVNGGEPLNPGEPLSFQYANSFRYPLSVSSVVCC